MNKEIIENNNTTAKKEEKNFVSSSSNINEENNKEKIEEKQKNINKKEVLPKVKIRKLNYYPTSVFSYFFIAFGLFFLSCNAAWSEYGSSSLSIPFLIIGVIQYILGIYDYFQGNNFLFIENIIFGIRYINFFMNYFEINGLKRTKKLYSNMQGVIDFILFGFICVFAILIRGEGLFYFIIYFFLALTTGLFILCGFAEDTKFIIKITGYLLFVNSLCFLFAGFSLVIHDTFKKKIIKFVEPRIR